MNNSLKLTKFYFHGLKFFTKKNIVDTVHNNVTQSEKKNNVTGYFTLIKICPHKETFNPVTKTNRFPVGLIKVIVKILKCVILRVFQKVYFCSYVTAKC